MGPSTGDSLELQLTEMLIMAEDAKAETEKKARHFIGSFFLVHNTQSMN
jgi:hypothetical protein